MIRAIVSGLAVASLTLGVGSVCLQAGPPGSSVCGGEVANVMGSTSECYTTSMSTMTICYGGCMQGGCGCKTIPILVSGQYKRRFHYPAPPCVDDRDCTSSYYSTTADLCSGSGS